MPCRSVDQRIPVEGVGEIAVTAFFPSTAPSTPAVLFLFPGGGFGRGYFDLQLDGLADHSQARWHAEHGMVTVTVDHLGVGESTLPREPDGGDGLTFQRIAAANDAAVRTVLDRIRAGSLDAGLPPLPGAVSVGVGQSMGGHIVAWMQAEHATFDAVSALGSSFTQTRLASRPGTRAPFRGVPMEQVYAAMADVDMVGTFHWPEEPEWVVAADMDPLALAPWRSAAVPACAGELMEPFAVARQAAAIRVPVLLVYGEQDVTVEPLADLAVFRSTPDLALLLVPRSAHMHNFAPTRHLVWARLESFAAQVLTLRRLLADVPPPVPAGAPAG